MTKTMKRTLDYCLMEDGSYFTAITLQKNLSDMTLRRVYEEKLSSRNMKTPISISFEKQNKIGKPLSLLFSMVEKKVRQGIPYMPVWEQIPDRYNHITLYTMVLRKDEGVSRYVRRLQMILRRNRIPIGLALHTSVISGNLYNIKIGEDVTVSGTSDNISNRYKLFFHIDEIIKVFKTLSRKCNYSNESLVNMNKQVRRPLWGPIRERREQQLKDNVNTGIFNPVMDMNSYATGTGIISPWVTLAGSQIIGTPQFVNTFLTTNI